MNDTVLQSFLPKTSLVEIHNIDLLSLTIVEAMMIANVQPVLFVSELFLMLHNWTPM